MANQPKAAGGSPPPDTAKTYYAETAALAKKVNDASTDFLKRLGGNVSIQQDPNQMVAGMKAAQDQYRRALAEAKASIKNIAVPAEKKGAQQLHDALQRCLDAEDGTIKAAGQLGQELEAVLTGKTLNVDITEVVKKADALEKARQKTWEDFKSAQEAFAKANKIPAAEGP
jgi:hypothetical protein